MTNNPPEHPRSWGKLRGEDIEMLRNPFYKRVQGEAKAVLERHLKKAHHLRHLNNVGGQHVRAPNLDPKQGPILGRKDLTVQEFDLTRAHSLSVLYGSPQIFRVARIPNFVNFALALALI